MLAAEPVRRILIVGDDRTTLGERLNFVAGGKRFRCDFIEPGLVNYGDVGGETELLRRETIQAALDSALGNPLTIGHVPARMNAVELQRLSKGRIDKVGFDAASGWFFCEGECDEKGRDMIRNNSKPSCGYVVLGFGPGGVWHNIPYAREITKIRFHHLALVDRPRYEDASIRLNSKSNNPPAMFNFKRLFSRPKEGGGEETVTETGTITPDTQIEVSPGVFKPAAEAIRNNDIKPDSQIEFPGKDGKPVKTTFADLCDAHAFRENAKAEQAAREEQERKNAKEAADRKAAEEAERKNQGPQHFRVLSSARATPPPVETPRYNSADTEAERLARGASRYGSGKN